jgi:hypothetical protein
VGLLKSVDEDGEKKMETKVALARDRCRPAHVSFLFLFLRPASEWMALSESVAALASEMDGQR